MFKGQCGGGLDSFGTVDEPPFETVDEPPFGTVDEPSFETVDQPPFDGDVFSSIVYRKPHAAQMVLEEAQSGEGGCWRPNQITRFVLVWEQEWMYWVCWEREADGSTAVIDLDF